MVEQTYPNPIFWPHCTICRPVIIEHTLLLKSLPFPWPLRPCSLRLSIHSSTCQSSSGRPTIWLKSDTIYLQIRVSSHRASTTRLCLNLNKEAIDRGGFSVGASVSKLKSKPVNASRLWHWHLRITRHKQPTRLEAAINPIISSARFSVFASAPMGEHSWPLRVWYCPVGIDVSQINS